MRSERAEQADEYGQLVLCQRADIVYLVEAGHHCGDRGVELHVLNILRDLLDGLVHYRFELLRRAGALGDIRQGRDSLEEALAALDAALFPRGGG